MVYEEKAKLDGMELPIQCILITITDQKNEQVPHYHEYIEMLYVFSGKIEVWMGGDICCINRGEFVLINSKVAHTVVGLHRENKYLVVKVAPEVLYVGEQFLYDFKYIIPFLQVASNQNKVFSGADIAGSTVPYLFESMLSEWNEKSFGYEMAIKTHVLELFLWIIRYCHKHDPYFNTDLKITSELASSLQKAMEYVDKNYCYTSAKEVAKLCNLSYSYFSRCFKQVMNKSFCEYLNAVRIRVAENLLVTTKLSMTEIATHVGYATSSYFIEQFKKQKKISPKQFRERFLQIHPFI